MGHYWLRHPQLAPDPEVQAHIATEIDQIEAFGRAIVRGEIKAPNGQAFTDVLWIGIGGSGLAPADDPGLQEEGAGSPSFLRQR